MPNAAVHFLMRPTRIFSVCGLIGPSSHSHLISKVTCRNCLKTQDGRLALRAHQGGEKPRGDGWTIEELVAAQESLRRVAAMRKAAGLEGTD